MTELFVCKTQEQSLCVLVYTYILDVKSNRYGDYLVDFLVDSKCCVTNGRGDRAPYYGGVEGPPHIFFDIMVSHTGDLVTRP